MVTEYVTNLVIKLVTKEVTNKVTISVTKYELFVLHEMLSNVLQNLLLDQIQTESLKVYRRCKVRDCNLL